MRFLMFIVIRKKNVLLVMEKIFASGKEFNKVPFFKSCSIVEKEGFHRCCPMVLIRAFYGTFSNNFHLENLLKKHLYFLQHRYFCPVTYAFFCTKFYPIYLVSIGRFPKEHCIRFYDCRCSN